MRMATREHAESTAVEDEMARIEIPVGAVDVVPAFRKQHAGSRRRPAGESLKAIESFLAQQPQSLLGEIPGAILEIRPRKPDGAETQGVVRRSIIAIH